ncbi:MAG: LysR family transcriptional regulator [Synergistaceae bacterium]|nr:LysR family transcriptional regulator [Synergistaceae bacterium]
MEQCKQCGSFSEAAKQLFITQPNIIQLNISILVKNLEMELGIILLLRSKRGMTITQEGKELLAYAYPMSICSPNRKNF